MRNLKNYIDILLQPVGPVSDTVTRMLERALQEQFSIAKFIVAPNMELRQEAFDDNRNQYVSPAIIRFIQEKCKKTRFHKILGICDANAYSGRLNFVFGEAQFGKRIAVIYLARLKEEFQGGRFDESVFLQRVVKEAVHELGHLFGLEHCRLSSCVMHFSNSLADTDHKDRDLCGGCKIKMERYLL